MGIVPIILLDGSVVVKSDGINMTAPVVGLVKGSYVLQDV